MAKKWALALHGGAGPIPGHDYSLQEAHLATLLKNGAERLRDGEAALDVVEVMVQGLEESGLYLAGKGAAPNLDGAYELDAAIMDGRNRTAGAVGALQGYRNPVSCARAVMEQTPNVLLIADGARKLLANSGLEIIEDPEAYYDPVEEMTSQDMITSTGTVGAVALDIYGDLSAATSTAGIRGKTPGRLGDTPSSALAHGQTSAAPSPVRDWENTSSAPLRRQMCLPASAMAAPSWKLLSRAHWMMSACWGARAA